MEKLINEFLELRSRTHKQHINLVERYMNGLVSVETYRAEDRELSAKLEVLNQVTNMIIKAISDK